MEARRAGETFDGLRCEVHHREHLSFCFKSRDPLPDSIFGGIEHPNYLGDIGTLVRKHNHVRSLGYSAHSHASHRLKLRNLTLVDFSDKSHLRCTSCHHIGV